LKGKSLAWRISRQDALMRVVVGRNETNEAPMAMELLRWARRRSVGSSRRGDLSSCSTWWYDGPGRPGSATMGMGLYVSLEKKVDGVDPLGNGITGKAALRAQDKLDKLATKLKVKRIDALISYAESDLSDLADEYGVEDEVEIPKETWFSASDGLKTIRALVAHLKEKPDSVPESKKVQEDLEEIERILVAAEKKKVRFHFSMDLP
jgi:hypothetical protein